MSRDMRVKPSLVGGFKGGRNAACLFSDFDRQKLRCIVCHGYATDVAQNGQVGRSPFGSTDTIDGLIAEPARFGPAMRSPLHTIRT
ncbi:hypothetical protein ACIQUG_32045 [Ensifer sp. NPDC090286]|uniref:hypothetical protein n=1 Tax=Ensifer sp. NPDC090286 TaxID=3363991 RepID=UPI00383B677F